LKTITDHKPDLILNPSSLPIELSNHSSKNENNILEFETVPEIVSINQMQMVTEDKVMNSSPTKKENNEQVNFEFDGEEEGDEEDDNGPTEGEVNFQFDGEEEGDDDEEDHNEPPEGEVNFQFDGEEEGDDNDEAENDKNLSNGKNDKSDSFEKISENESEDNILEKKPEPSKSILKKPSMRKKRVSFHFDDPLDFDKMVNPIDENDSIIPEQSGSDVSFTDKKLSYIPKQTDFELKNFNPNDTANISLMQAYPSNGNDSNFDSLRMRENTKHKLNNTLKNFDDSDDDQDQLYFLKGSKKHVGDEDKHKISDVITKKKFMILSGVLFFLLFGSICLWVILFGILNSRNLEIGEYVMETPTLGDFYKNYQEFYGSYDKNLDKLKEMNKELDLSESKYYIVTLIRKPKK
jgi:hypothetical protein